MLCNAENHCPSPCMLLKYWHRFPPCSRQNSDQQFTQQILSREEQSSTSSFSFSLIVIAFTAYSYLCLGSNTTLLSRLL